MRPKFNISSACNPLANRHLISIDFTAIINNLQNSKTRFSKKHSNQLMRKVVD